MKFLKSPWFYLAVFVVIAAFIALQLLTRVQPEPTIKDSDTTFIGFNHIGLVVDDMETMLRFYQKATGFPLLERTTIHNNRTVNRFYGMDSLSVEKAILKGPNMLIELVRFIGHDSVTEPLLPSGPGMTHTCFQSTEAQSSYRSFLGAGINMLSRGNEPIDLGGYGVTYAYGYDPEGNMIEMEQLSDLVVKMTVGKTYSQEHPLWMTQVAIASPDIERLITFYEGVLRIPPYRSVTVSSNTKLDDIVGIDSAALKMAWFGLDGQGKKLELMQYLHPSTPSRERKQSVTDLGYTYSFEVTDIEQEYHRLTELGVQFISQPIIIGEFLTALAYDIDGNLFSLRQAVKPNSDYSLINF